MGYPSRSAVILAVGVVMFAVVPHSSAKEPASREEIRDAIARWWDSTDSIDATFELTRSDNGTEYAYQEDRQVIASGGRYFVRSFFISKDGRREEATNQCVDGAKAYRISPVPGNPDVASVVTVLNSPCTNDTYEGGMNDLLWLLMPGGKRLNRWLDDGAELTVERGDDGSDRYFVGFHFRWKTNPVRCELDPAHDWLPRLVEVGKSGSALRIQVTRYKLAGGRFIPSEADLSKRRAKEPELLSRFLLRSVSVNGDLDPGIFKPKGLVTGTLIEDEETGNARIHGGNARERQAFLERYYPKPKTGAMKDDVKSLEPLRAERTPSEWPVIPILSASTILLVASIIVHRRRTRPAPRTVAP